MPPTTVDQLLLAMLLGSLGVICVYGLHRTLLLLLWAHSRGRCEPPGGPPPTCPDVTVQLPVYNEPAVVERLIGAVCSSDYPLDRLQVQVLDDSTDESPERTARCCASWAARGVDIEHIRRESRSGFKAGALRDGLPRATGEYVLILDADFVAPPNLVRALLDGFVADDIGMVQTRWTHLNERHSLLTRAQATLLDGHFLIEQVARAGSCRWFNFNGTAGMWRRRCIEDAGGWQADTLTEDTDLSYRAQMRGWRFRFLEEPGCPAELPGTMPAFMSQQHRWSKGLVQTGLKLLPRVLRSDASWRVKGEVFFHLTSPVVQLATLLLVLLAPLIVWRMAGSDSEYAWIAVGLIALLLGTGSAALFYTTAQLVRGTRLLRALAMIPVLLALGVGISLRNARAVLEALLGVRSPFVRTPKVGRAGSAEVDPAARRRGRRLPAGVPELTLSAVMLATAWPASQIALGFVSAPFLLLFAAGFAWTGLGQLRPGVASPAPGPRARRGRAPVLGRRRRATATESTRDAR